MSVWNLETLTKAMPETVAALRALSQSATEGMDRGLLELLKARASQLNGCAYCLQLHLNWAREHGISQEKLDRLVTWREAEGFTEVERAVLGWTEALTVPRRHDLEAARVALEAVFEEAQILKLTVAIASINAWNRVISPLGFPSPPAK